MFGARSFGSRLARDGLSAWATVSRSSAERSANLIKVSYNFSHSFRTNLTAYSTKQGSSPEARSLGEAARHCAQCYKELSKLRLSALVVSTAAAGYVMGSAEEIQWAGLFWTSVGTMGASACANTINQLMEVKYDASMNRTMRRPLPAGRITRGHALAFAVTTGLTGISLLLWKTNNLTAALGAANIVLYTMAYTPLKRISIANTWIGAVVGAIPPLMGWAAASGKLDAGAYVLAAALYFWQLPHFMALAWMCREDYARGKYRMISLVDTTGRRTAACALRNCVYLLPLGPIALAAGVVEWPFALEATALTTYFTYASMQFLKEPSAARTCFRASLLYLPLFMAAMVVHRIPQTEDTKATADVLLQRACASLQYCSTLLGITTDVKPVEETKAAEFVPEAPSPRLEPKRAIGIPDILAPFPFLPLPPLPQCPSRIYADSDNSSSSKECPPSTESKSGKISAESK
ncbi:Protoheme IX farnesyltransferase, mitochondrial [Cymbomonas tetramitiformis]|uniref:Protoheme IX farnesyltransferase, mitochondrial n=1 Tax=Cymbomonas tetramitiformis TaxID=36881 RepID=A0AAE0KWA3_9CHLO|nr:Protoheme IX farnesyltransferase, mitochondrial [Cymbomonas tetramitiformis]